MDGIPKDVLAAVATLCSKHRIWFVDWCPASFKAVLIISFTLWYLVEAKPAHYEHTVRQPLLRPRLARTTS